jgi:DNA-binding response OmpR family regulator
LISQIKQFQVMIENFINEFENTSKLSHREAIKNLSKDEAIDYLCMLLDEMTVDPIKKIQGLTLVESKIYDTLYRRSPNVVPYESLVAIIDGMKADDGKLVDLRSHIKRMRRKLDNWDIINDRQFGYRMIPYDGPQPKPPKSLHPGPGKLKKNG